MPNLPTDSLYKFLTIGGIALIGIGFLVPDRYEAALRPVLTEATRELYRMMDANELLVAEMEALRTTIEADSASVADINLAEMQRRASVLRLRNQRPDSLGIPPQPSKQRWN